MTGDTTVNDVIRLVASDVDGTLLPKGEHTLRPDILGHIRKLLDMGVTFCACSGRQYSSLRRLFEPVADEIYYISDNGTVLWDMGKEKHSMSVSQIPRKYAKELTKSILNDTACEAMVATPEVNHLISRNSSLCAELNEFFGIALQEAASIDEIIDPITKISAYCYDGAVVHIEAMKELWSSIFHVVQADVEWVDFTLNSKGQMLRMLCEHLAIPMSQVAALGDNYNDISMLEAVGYPMLHAGAAKPLLDQFPQQFTDGGTILQQIIDFNHKTTMT